MVARHRFAARRYGRAARDLLRSGASLHVMAVFDRSFYIERESRHERDHQRVACIGDVSLGAGPLNVSCEIDGAVPRLRVGDEVAIETKEAELWTPPPRSSANPALVRNGLERLAEEASRQSDAGDFARLVPSLARGEALRGGYPLLDLAIPAIEALREALRAPKFTAPKASFELAGLGPGLTPSGDDFVVGAVIAWHRLRREEWARALGDSFFRHAISRTNAISLAHLAAAIGGEGSEALHGALASLLSGAVIDLAELGRTGHSSGWDMLAGASFALRAWLEWHGRLFAKSSHPRLFSLVEPAPPWGDYGHILVHGMTSHRLRHKGLLQLERTGPYVPPIAFSGIGDIVVRDDVRALIAASGLSGFSFRRVIRARIVKLHWHEWDQDGPEPAEYPNKGEPEDYILDRPHDKETAHAIGPMWEMVIHDTAQIERLGSRMEPTIRLVRRSWNGDDFFRAPTVAWTFISERARDWLYARFPEHVEFIEVEIS
jgi:hypothetical protein